LKQLVRTYIQKAGINLYTDTFKLLVKYDDCFILEGVCEDIYRRCSRSIMEKCADDDIEFNDYVNEIIKDDPEMKNIVFEKLILEFSVHNKETETKDELTPLKRKVVEIEEKEDGNISEIKRLVIASKNELTELVAAHKDLTAEQKSIVAEQKGIAAEQKGIVSGQKGIVSGQKGIVAEQKIQTGLTTELKNLICSNCRSIQCRTGEPIRKLWKGMKVESQKHSCHVYPGGTEPVVVPLGKIGIMNQDFSITWDLGSGKKVTCMPSQVSNVVHACFS